MEAFFRSIHAAPDNSDAKFAFAEWLDETDDPRAEVIRSREEVRRAVEDADALSRCLTVVAELLGADAEKSAVTARLRILLEVRTLIVHEADCATRVLSVYEEAKPADHRPRQAIEAARAFASMRMGREDLLAAAAKAREAADASEEPEWSAATAAAVAAEFGEPYGADTAATLATNTIALILGPDRAELENTWQFSRLLDLWIYGWDYPLSTSEQDAVKSV